MAVTEEILRFVVDPSGAVTGGTQIKEALEGIATATVDANGRMRDANGRFVKSSQEAGAAATATGNQVQAAGGKFAGFSQQVLASAVGFTAVTAGAQLLRGAFDGVIGGAIRFESSFAGVRKTVDGTPAELAAIAGAFRQMATEIPVSVDELNRIGEAAGQLGVRKEDLVGFTRTMADLGATTNLTSDEAATSLAQFMNVMGTAGEDVGRLASAIVALGNDGASTESQIVGMSQRISGAGAQIGLTEAQVLGFASALSSVGIEAEAGGSSISRVMIDIAQSVELGDDKLATFAATAGMAIPEFSRLFREDAAGAIIAFIEGLGRMKDEGGNVFGVLDELELSEIRVRQALLNASSAGDLLRESIRTGTEAWRENTALTLEAEQRYATTASQIAVARGNLAELGISIGENIIPALGAMAAGATAALQGFDSLPESTQNMALLGAMMTPLLPLAMKIGPAFLTMGAYIRNGALTAQSGTLIILGLVAAIAALDYALDRWTGEGLFARLLGGDDGPTLASEAEGATLRFADAMTRAGAGADIAVVGLDHMRDSLERYNEAVAAGGDAKDLSQAVVADIIATGEAMKEAGVSTLALAMAYETLGPVAGAWFAEASGYDKVLRAIEVESAQAGTKVGSLANGFRDTGEAMAETGAAAATSRGPIDDWVGTFETLEDRVKSVNDRLAILIGNFADLNPAVANLKAENAFLAEELDDVTRAGGEYSEKLGLTTDQIRDQIAANNEAIESWELNQGAIAGARQALELYMGSEGLGALLGAMAAAKVPQETQIDIVNDTREAYQLLADGSISKAVGAFGTLKDALSPEAWAVIADAIGPALVDSINAGIADPNQRQAIVDEVNTTLGLGLTGPRDDLVNSVGTPATVAADAGEEVVNRIADGMTDNEAAATAAAEGVIVAAGDAGVTKADPEGKRVGKAFGDGLSVGLDGSQGAVRASAEALAAVVSAATAGMLGVQSPSTVGIYQGEMYAQGIAIGISNGVGEVATAAGEMAAVAMSELDGLIRTINELSDGARLAFWGVQSSGQQPWEGPRQSLAAFLASNGYIVFEDGSVAMAPGAPHGQGGSISTGSGATPFGHNTWVYGEYYGATPEEIAAWQAAANASHGINTTPGGQSLDNPVIHGQAAQGRTWLGTNGQPEEVLLGTFDPSGAGGRGMWYWGNGEWRMEPYPGAGGGTFLGDAATGFMAGDEYQAHLTRQAFMADFNNRVREWNAQQSAPPVAAAPSPTNHFTINVQVDNVTDAAHAEQLAQVIARELDRKFLGRLRGLGIA